MLKHKQGAEAAGACGSSPETWRRGMKFKSGEAWTRRRSGRCLWFGQLGWSDRLCRSLASTYPASQLPLVHSFLLSHLRPQRGSSPQPRCNKLVSAACDREIARTPLVLPSLASPSFIVSGSRAAICRCRPLLVARASRARSCSTKHSRIARPVIQVQQAATSRTLSHTGTVGCSRFARQ
jgi:hypothetical protein